MMQKFPVTSSNGNEYLVEADFQSNMMGKILLVTLYKEVGYKLLWMKKSNFTEIFSLYFWEKDPEYSDIVKAVQKVVSEYEEKIQKTIDKERFEKELFSSSEKQLNDWDGVCK